MRRPLVLLVLLLPLAGCASEAPDLTATILGCEARLGGVGNSLAPLAAWLVEDAEAAARRLAAAVGDALREERAAGPGARGWATEQGALEWWSDGERAALVWSPQRMPEDRAALLRRALDALAPDETLRYEDAAAWQLVDGVRFEERAGAWRADGLAVGPLYDVDRAAPRLDDAQLQARADEVAACLAGANDARAPLAGYASWSGSLVRVARAGSCDVSLDVVSGALLRVGPCLV